MTGRDQIGGTGTYEKSPALLQEDLIQHGNAFELAATAAHNLAADLALESDINVTPAEIAGKRCAQRFDDAEVAGAFLILTVAKATMNDCGRAALGICQRLCAADFFVEIGNAGFQVAESLFLGNGQISLLVFGEISQRAHVGNGTGTLFLQFM